MAHSILQTCLTPLLVFASVVTCLPQSFSERTVSHPLVFAHYMLIEQPPNGDYTKDIALAKGAGINAFAVNYGGWNANWPQLAAQLDTFYTQAAARDFKLFPSFDLTSVTDPAMIVNLTNTYAKHTAQLQIEGKPMLSSFQTDPPAWDWQNDVLSKLNTKPFFIPGTLSDDASSAFSNVDAFADGIFPWIHNDLSTTEEAAADTAFAGNRTANGNKWMAAVAPWFFKRFSADMNWANKQDDGTFIHKWLHLLKLKPEFIEIVTWNDWGESSYIGPANPAPEDPNGGCYWSYYSHEAFLKMTKIFAKAFHAGKTSVRVDKAEEDVFMFYRTQPALTNGVNKTLPFPSYASYMHDDVFVVSFLNSSTSISLTSGDNKPVTYTASAGVSKKAIPFALRPQTLCAENAGGLRVRKTGPEISGQWADYNGNVVAL